MEAKTKIPPSIGWSIGRTMFFSDLIVITMSPIYLDLTRVMYTLVAVFML